MQLLPGCGLIGMASGTLRHASLSQEERFEGNLAVDIVLES